MKKVSNWIILVGVVLTTIVCIYKFVDFHFDIPNMQNKYLWWGLCALGIVAILTIAMKKRTTQTTSPRQSKGKGFLVSVMGFLKGLLGFSFVIALICIVLGALFYGGLLLKTSVDKAISRNGNTEIEDVVVVKSGEYTIVELDGRKHWKFDTKIPMVIEYLGSDYQPVPVIQNGEWVNRVINSPEDVVDRVEYDENEQITALRFFPTNKTAREQSFTIRKW